MLDSRNICIVICLAAALCGCQQAQWIERDAQSHFDYPNSNVKALGPVRVKVEGHGSWFGHAWPTADDHEKVYNAALMQVQGADLVINYVKTIRLYAIPMLYQWNELELEGTAAKMEVGRKKLR